MKAILAGAILSTLLFVLLAIAILISLIKKKKGWMIVSLVSFLLLINVAAFTAYQFTRKSYWHLSQIFKGRSGEDIYTGLLGPSPYHCTKILKYNDALAPLIDDAITIHFETCPAEVQRILAQHAFTLNNNVFTPDSAQEFYFDTLGGHHVINVIVSKDSTHVQYRDILP